MAFFFVTDRIEKIPKGTGILGPRTGRMRKTSKLDSGGVNYGSMRGNDQLKESRGF